MNLDYTPLEEAFRLKVRQFIQENYPKNLRRKQDANLHLDREDRLVWHRILAKQGWAAPSWPLEHGGTDWTPIQKYIFDDELAQADALPLSPFGLSMLAPVIYTFGTEEQKARFLPPIYNGEIWWAQGYSEPGAGSDLASLKTRAERITEDGRDYYLVNGQKTWTSYAQFADWGFFLVRTDPACKPQAGISFLLIDLKTPGITVRPIITVEGHREVNDVYLDNVKVPVENRIHEENKGWTCAKFLLVNERTGIANVGRSRMLLRKLKAAAADEASDTGGRLIDDPFFRRKLTQLGADLVALEYTELRMLAAETEGKGPGAESSMLKIKGTEIQQRIQELMLEAAGHYGAVFMDEDAGDNFAVGPQFTRGVAGTYFNGRKTSIYGGSNEIQRNIIAKAVLGL